MTVTQSKRIERLEKSHKEEVGIDEKYILATDLLEDVWLNIDWDNIDSSRRRNIYNEFEGQVKALAKCYSELAPFLSKLCARFNSFLNKYQTRDIVKQKKGRVVLEVYRSETQMPMLLLRLRREQAAVNFKKRLKGGNEAVPKMQKKETS